MFIFKVIFNSSLVSHLWDVPTYLTNLLFGGIVRCFFFPSVSCTITILFVLFLPTEPQLTPLSRANRISSDSSYQGTYLTGSLDTLGNFMQKSVVVDSYSRKITIDLRLKIAEMKLDSERRVRSELR